MRLTAMVLAFVVATTWPAVAAAEHPSVRKAQRAYKQLRFEDVLREVAEARKSPLDPADDLELTRLEAYTYAVYDDAQRSVEAFSRLLTLQPSWALPPDTSPKIRRYFLDAIFAGLYRYGLLILARLIGWIDRYLVDGVLNVLSALTLRAGDRLRGLQTGLAQDYVYGVALGVLVLFVLAQWGLR